MGIAGGECSHQVCKKNSVSTETCNKLCHFYRKIYQIFLWGGTIPLPDPSPEWRGTPPTPFLCGLHLYKLSIILAMLLIIRCQSHTE